MARETADLVIVGGGTIGGWAAYFARTNGAKKVVVLERDLVGAGASSRAAGMVRAQGGTPNTVRLGQFSIDFYNRQRELFGVDSGFRELGYVILAITKRDVELGRERVAMQRETGLDARWLDATQVCRENPTLATEGHRGGSFVSTDGAIDPPRNVLAYTMAMRQTKVDLRERTPFVGLRTRRARGGDVQATGVLTPDGEIATAHVLLTGGPSLRGIAKQVGARVFVGGARHQIAISEPHPDFEVERLPMIFDIHAGIYWRLEDGGLLWGMSNPDETPGEATEIDWSYLRRMQRRLAKLVPVTKDLGIRKVWAATIEYTPDHMPIFGPVVRRDGSEVRGATIASTCGHGMMWGPGVAKVAADLATKGSTRVVTDVEDLFMTRFDDEGKSPFYDPIALPFPVAADDD